MSAEPYINDKVSEEGTATSTITATPEIEHSALCIQVPSCMPPNHIAFQSMFKSGEKPGAKQKVLFEMMWRLFGPFGKQDGKMLNSATVTWMSLQDGARSNSRQNLFRRCVFGLDASFVSRLKAKCVPHPEQKKLAKVFNQFDADDPKTFKCVGLCALQPTEFTETETDYWLLLGRKQPFTVSGSKIGGNKCFLLALLKMEVQDVTANLKATFILGKEAIKSKLVNYFESKKQTKVEVVQSLGRKRAPSQCLTSSRNVKQRHFKESRSPGVSFEDSDEQ